MESQSKAAQDVKLLPVLQHVDSLTKLVPGGIEPGTKESPRPKVLRRGRESRQFLLPFGLCYRDTSLHVGFRLGGRDRAADARREAFS